MAKLPSLESFTVTVLTSLIGETIFYGKMMKNKIFSFEVNHSYIIDDGDFENAIKAFSAHFLNLLRYSIAQHESIIDKLYLAT